MKLKQRIPAILRMAFLLFAGLCIALLAATNPSVREGSVVALKKNPGLLILNAIPVLPSPAHSEPGEKKFPFNNIAKIEWKGLNQSSSEKLLWHWKKFRQEHPGAISRDAKGTVQMGLPANDKRFAALIAELAPHWLDSIGREGYILVFNAHHRVIAANTETGLFYGLQTLKQLIRSKYDHEILIADWPAFGHRVIYDDISRGPISTVDYIKKQIERMAEIKINYLSFYIEHIVQPLSHSDFAPADGKLTIAQIKELSSYAEKFHMQLIGSFQSFGHFEKILSLPQYASMGATSTLISPTDPKARKFLEDVIGELCDAFDAPFFNVNCDETFDLGQGTTKPYVDSMGAAAFYAGHLKFLYDIVKRHGKKMMMWGDFVLEHEEVIDMLPKDIIYLTWEYGDQSSFDQWITPFATRNLNFMVCPGILNTYRMFPDMVMAKANITGFTREGKQQGATGVITTIWDDGGAYLFSGDWYGVYVAAEKSWNTDPAANDSFDERYEVNAYGTENGNYVKALFTVMQLRRLPLTYNLNDRLWHQKLLPDSGKKLIINNKSADSALIIIDEAAGFINASQPHWNKVDIRTLYFSIDQYKLMIESRIQIASIAKAYQRAGSLSKSNATESNQILSESLITIDKLIKRYADMRSRFKRAWLAENQHYCLNVVLEPYDKKIAALQQLEADLKEAKAAMLNQHSLPPASTVRLDIEESNNFYFQNWMMVGAFPQPGKDKFPSFLYSDNDEYNKPPSPGDFTQYQGKMYRWRKFASDDGGMIDLNEYYGKKENAIIYAYCLIRLDSAATVNAFASADDAMEIYCNGKKVYGDLRSDGTDRKEAKLSLQLLGGTNHILIKLQKEKAGNGLFTFRLENGVAVTNHKHKYQVNVKNELHEAD